MTIEKAAWVVNGPRIDGSLARRAQYAATAGAQGRVTRGDLVVTALPTPGQGVQITAGSGLVLNQYMTKPIETYVVSNPDTHVIPASEMPASSPSARSYMVAIVLGDPSFAQIGHPFMTSASVTEGSENSFQYVRVVVIPCAAGATSLPGSFPKLELARLDIPANTTTITSGMITDVSSVALPRTDQRLFTNNSYNNEYPLYIPAGNKLEDWGAWAPTVRVPTWASRALVKADIVSRIDSSAVNVYGSVAVRLGNIVGAQAWFDFQATGSKDGHRPVLMAASQIGPSELAPYRGQVVPVKIQGFEQYPASPTNLQKLKLSGGCLCSIDVRFFED